MRRAAPWLTLSLVLLAATARADCPRDTICVANGCQDGAGPQGSASGSAFGQSSSGSYDLLQLTVGASASAFNGDLTAGNGSVVARDTYVATGPVSGAPLDLSLSFHASGYGSSSGSFINASAGVSVTAIPGSTTTLGGGTSDFFNPYFFVDATTPIALHVTEGQPFTLEFRVFAHCVSGNAQMGGQCTFVDLPPSVVVTSCTGFNSSPPVAVRRTSFGELKAIYR